jgi:hypothetical protein
MLINVSFSLIRNCHLNRIASNADFSEDHQGKRKTKLEQCRAPPPACLMNTSPQQLAQATPQPSVVWPRNGS